MIWTALALRLEPIEAIEHEPTDPSGALWPAGTPLLVKLVAWAGWGHFLHFRADDPR